MDSAVAAAENDGDEDREGAGAAVAAIASSSAANKNDLDAAGDVSEWDETSRPQTPAAPLPLSPLPLPLESADAANDAAAAAAAAAYGASSSRSSSASRLRRAISNNLLRGGGGGGLAKGGAGAEGNNNNSSVVGGSTNSVIGRSLRLAASRRFSRGNRESDPALATVADGGGGGNKKDDNNDNAAESEKLALGALVRAEGRAEGGVGGRVYAGWARRLGASACALVAFGLLAGQGAYLFAEYWVSILSPSSSEVSSSSTDTLKANIAGRAVSQA